MRASADSHETWCTVQVSGWVILSADQIAARIWWCVAVHPLPLLIIINPSPSFHSHNANIVSTPSYPRALLQECCLCQSTFTIQRINFAHEWVSVDYDR